MLGESTVGEELVGEDIVRVAVLGARCLEKQRWAKYL